ncbi:MAG: hypothetical protein HOL45_09590 [Chloroflexi bacterium]|nr:hypothetical protein [Chloroflexota bacterium]
MTNDPDAIADRMIEEHGLAGALQTAQEATQVSLKARDNYSTSVWREIKRVLRGRIGDD